MAQRTRRAIAAAVAAALGATVVLAGCTPGPDPRLDATTANRDATFSVLAELADALPASEWEGSWQPWTCMTDPESYGIWVTGDISGATTSAEREQWAGQIEGVLDAAGWDPTLDQYGDPDALGFDVRSPDDLIDGSQAGITVFNIELSTTRPARFTVVSPCVEGPRWLVTTALEDAVAPW